MTKENIRERKQRKDKKVPKEKRMLLDLKGSYESRMSQRFDPTLSAKLDCILFLLEQ